MSFLASDEKLSRGVYSFCPALPSLLFESMIGITWKFLVFWFTLLKLSIDYRCSFPLPLPPLFLDKHCRFTVFSDVWKWARWGVGGCVVFSAFCFCVVSTLYFLPWIPGFACSFFRSRGSPPFVDRGESLSCSDAPRLGVDICHPGLALPLPLAPFPRWGAWEGSMVADCTDASPSLSSPRLACSSCGLGW